MSCKPEARLERGIRRSGLSRGPGDGADRRRGRGADQAWPALYPGRRDVLADVKSLLKDKEITEDDERRSGDEIQKITDKFVAEIDQLLAVKEKDLLEV